MAPTLLRTSHGGDVTDYEEHFHRSVKQIQERQNKVIGFANKQGVTAWEMSKLLFPKVDNLNRFLATSEAIAHLDLAVAEGKLRAEKRGEMEFYLCH